MRRGGCRKRNGALNSLEAAKWGPGGGAKEY